MMRIKQNQMIKLFNNKNIRRKQSLCGMCYIGESEDKIHKGVGVFLLEEAHCKTFMAVGILYRY